MIPTLIEPLEARIAPATLSISPASISEGDSGTKELVFQIRLDVAAETEVQVNFATEDGSATAGGDAASGGADFITATGTVTFAPGETVKSIIVEVNGDTVGEDDENFSVRLSDAVGATIGTATASGTILNDAKFTINNPSILEGDTGTRDLVFTVGVQEAPLTQTVSVAFATENGTAIAGSDYIARTGTLTFEPGTTSQDLAVQINGDTTAEVDENFHVRLTNPVGGTVQTPLGVGTILNDPKLQINSVSKLEGNSGETDFIFTVSLTERAPGDSTTVTVNYSTVAGTAEEGVDYTGIADGVLQFAPNTNSQTITVKVHGDTEGEVDENFFVQLADPVGASLKEGADKGTGTIQNDARLSIADARIVEGNSGTKVLVFDVTLTEKPPADVTVQYATADGTGSGAARQVEDYVATSGTLTFTENGTQQVSVTVNGDTRAEGVSEQFLVNLSNPTNATLLDSSGTGTIIDDDLLEVSNISVVEGDADIVVLFTVTLKNTTVPAGQVLKVKYKTEDGSGNPADAAATSGGAVPDYVGIAEGELSFAPGETTKTVAVTVKGDETFESAVEKFSLVLTEAGFYTSGSTSSQVGEDIPISTPRGVATITQSDAGDALPTVSVLDAKKVEGNSGECFLQFTVQLSAPVGYDTRIVFSTEELAGSATAGQDYTSVTGGVLEIAAGQSTGVVQIPIIGDTTEELDEMFALVLSEAKLVGGDRPAAGTPLVITDNRAVGTIQNDEQTVTIALDDSPENTGLETSGVLRFKVTLSSASSNEVVVSFKTEDLTAISTGTFADYTSQTSTVTFAPGQTEAFIEVAILDDARDEVSETFKVVLTDVQNAAFGASANTSAIGTILDDDSEPTVTVVQEGEAVEGAPVKFKVTLSAPLQHDITIPYTFTNGTAVGGTSGSARDFVNSPGSVVIKVGETTAEILVNTVQDDLSEASETFNITLADHANTAGAATGIGTIKDDGDPLPRVSVAGSSILEGNSGQKMAEFVVTLSEASGQDVVIGYQLFDRTATAGRDYAIPAETTITIPAGQTTGKILVPILGDTETEANEEFIVRLASAQNAVITGNEAVGTILDDERQFSVVFEGETESPETITVAEPANDATTGATVRFKVVRSGDTSVAASVQYTTADGVDREGVRGAVSTGDRKDFVALSGTVNFAAGQTESDWITLTINNDNVHEGLEEFFVRLQNGVNGSPAEGTGTGTVAIADNDTTPIVTISNPSVGEGNLTGTTATRTDLVYNVTLSNPTELGSVTLKYATANGTATAGTARADYEALSSTTLTFAPGETSKNVTVKVLGDLRDEYDETVLLNLTELNERASFGVGVTQITGTGTILDNDLAPTIRITDLSSVSGSTITGATYNESDGLTTSKFFRVSLSGESEKEISFKYYTVNGTAVAGADFIGISEAEAVTLTFSPASGDAAGQTTKDISINVLEDSIAEDAETFEVRLTGVDPALATVLDDRGQAVIQDNDKAIFTINDVTVVEGNDPEAPTVARFLVSLANTVERAVTINYTTVDGAATASGPFADYLFTSGTLTFDANTATAFIDVPIIGDSYKEVAESFTVRLSGGSNVQFAKADGVGTIQNGDDAIVGVAIEDVRLVEGAQGSTAKAQFTVVTSGPLESGQTLTVQAATRNGLAVAGSDYTSKTSTLTFSGTTVSQVFEVNVTGDNSFEEAENFFVDLSDAKFAAGTGTVQVARDSAMGLIYNDDVLQIDAQTVRWIDVDGDVVTLKISKGALSITDPGDFDFINQITENSNTVSLSSVGGLALRMLNLQSDGREFQGASISITAEPQVIFDPTGNVFLGDGRVDIGWINAGTFSDDGANFFGIDLGKVTVDGGLAKLTVGDRTISSPAIDKLSVENLGVNAARVGIDNTLSYFQGPVGKVAIAGDMEGQMQVVAAQFGRIDSLEIGGTLGGDAAQAGLVLFSGKLGKATIGQIAGGDGANSGSLRGDATFATSKLGKVTVLGDIVGGAGVESGTINAVTIGKVTVMGSVIGGGGNQSGTVGGVLLEAGDLVTNSIKKVVIGGNIEGGDGKFSGSVNARMIKNVSANDVIGGAGERSGAIRAGVLSKVALEGDIVGGSGTGSGLVLADSSLALDGQVKFGQASIDGRIIGGAGTSSGALASDGTFDSIKVAGQLPEIPAGEDEVQGAVIGGSGAQSGRIHSNFALGKLVLGLPQNSSGQYSIIGGSGADSGSIALGAAKKVTLYGDIQGGSHNNTGGINVVNRLNNLTLNGSLLGGDSVQETATSLGRAVDNTGYITAGQIGKIVVTGDVVSGEDFGAGLNSSGLIAASRNGVALPGTIDSLEIRGNVIGNETEPVLITALGWQGKVAIEKLTIGGNTQFLNLLAGLAKPGVDNQIPRNADAAIGRVTFEGNVKGVNIAAGAAFGDDGRFGTDDDEILLAAPSSPNAYLNEANVYSRIASVIIKGQILAGPVDEQGEPLAFGIVAQEVASVTVGGQKVPLQPGEANDLTPVALGSDTGLFVVELPRTQS